VLYTGTMGGAGPGYCGARKGDEWRSCDGNLGLGGVLKDRLHAFDGRGEATMK
jgi:phosphoribosylaminoimidazole carboxylase (NCAIR synthetase)